MVLWLDMMQQKLSQPAVLCPHLLATVGSPGMHPTMRDDVTLLGRLSLAGHIHKMIPGSLHNMVCCCKILHKNSLKTSHCISPSVASYPMSSVLKLDKIGGDWDSTVIAGPNFKVRHVSAFYNIAWYLYGLGCWNSALTHRPLGDFNLILGR